MSNVTGRPTHVRAAVLSGPRQLAVQQFPFPELRDDGQVLLRMIASGICGTDKHTYRGETKQYVGTEYERSTPFPIIQGHENLGVVEQVVGAPLAHDGSPLQVGDRVVPAPNRACGSCKNCKRGFPYYLCRALENYGNSLSCAEPPHLFGGMAEYLVVRPGTPVFRVPEGLRHEVAVLTEIFAVTHSLERATALRPPNGFRPGDSVLVVGAGSLGIAHAVKAWMMGAAQVLVVDPSGIRLAIVEELIGARTFLPSADLAREVRKATQDDGADVVVNATGFPGSFATATSLVRDGGTIIEVGAFVHMGEETFDPSSICGRNLAILGVGGEDPGVYAATMALLARHQDQVEFERMISHRFSLDDAAEAMVVAQDPTVSAKVIIRPDH